MDALLSAPILTVFLLPSLTSYSTSLNLLFFTLTWSTLVLSHSPLRIELFSVLIIRLLFYLIPSFISLGFDAALPSVAIQLKENGADALPLNATGSSHRRGNRLGRIAALSTTNVLVGVALQAALEWLCTDVFQLRSVVRVTTTLPFPWSIAKDLTKGLLAREVLTYALHRYGLHHHSSPFARYHQRYYHSLKMPCALTAHYDHPIAYVLLVFLPTYIPAFIFRFHLLTYHLFLILVSLEELFTSSGYTYLPSGFILGGMARRKERHLIADGEGNFGVYGISDFLMGTNIGSDVIEDIRDEAEEHNVENRVRAKVTKAVRKGRKPRTRSSDENSG